MSGQILDFNKALKQGEAAKSGVDVEDIRNRLHEDVRGFINWLFSGRAYFTKNEARIGNIYGEPGNSLSISLTSGEWYDHATKDGGDLISLYRAWRGYQGDSNFLLSLKEIARDYFSDPVEIERPTWQPTPLAQIEKRKNELGSKPRQENIELGAPVANYRYYDLHGNIIASVVRFEPDGTRDSKTFRPWCFKTVDGKPKWVMGAPDMRPLYRLPEIATSPVVVLCEGEGCADALNSVGITATTAMQGANAPIEKTDWTPLAGKTVIIWPDKDQPGLDYAQRASERLQALGCTVLGITLPDDAPESWDAADCIRDGGNAHAMVKAAQPVVMAKATRPRVRLVNISDLGNIKPPSWLIQDVLTESGLSMVWGRSGSLKSFAVLDMGLCIATGLSWHGKPVKQGRVIYLAAEGSQGLIGRIAGWMQSRGRDLPAPDFQVIPHGLTLVNQGDMDALIEAIQERAEAPVFIVIDTLSRTFGSGNPNQPADMNAFVAACDRLKDATGAHVLVVHHGGKDTDKNELGNESLRNASDTVIHVRRKDGTIELINEAPKGKQKDAEEFPTISLRSVKIAYELNDKEHTTLVLNLNSDESGLPGKSDPAQPLGGVQKAIIQALSTAGEPLGLMRLQAMTGKGKSSLCNALPVLEARNLILKMRSDDDARALWKLVSE